MGYLPVLSTGKYPIMVDPPQITGFLTPLTTGPHLWTSEHRFKPHNLQVRHTTVCEKMFSKTTALTMITRQTVSFLQLFFSKY